MDGRMDNDTNVDGPPPPLGDVLTLLGEGEAYPSRLPSTPQ